MGLAAGEEFDWSHTKFVVLDIPSSNSTFEERMKLIQHIFIYYIYVYDLKDTN
jgi:hypothetical protein